MAASDSASMQLSLTFSGFPFTSDVQWSSWLFRGKMGFSKTASVLSPYYQTNSECSLWAVNFHLLFLADLSIQRAYPCLCQLKDTQAASSVEDQVRSFSIIQSCSPLVTRIIARSHIQPLSWLWHSFSWVDTQKHGPAWRVIGWLVSLPPQIPARPFTERYWIPDGISAAAQRP